MRRAERGRMISGRLVIYFFGSFASSAAYGVVIIHIPQLGDEIAEPRDVAVATGNRILINNR